MKLRFEAVRVCEGDLGSLPTLILFSARTAAQFWGMGSSGTFHKHGKNMKITGVIFRSKINSEVLHCCRNLLFHPRDLYTHNSWDFPGRSQPVNFSQEISASRARRPMCVVVIISSACARARRGCAWLVRLHVHVQAMMSQMSCCLVQSTASSVED